MAIEVLLPVDHAVGVSGPHRNVVGTLNALGRRSDVRVRLVTGRIDPDEPYARATNITVHRGFAPADRGAWARNLALLERAARGADLVYVPTNLRSLLYAQAVRGLRPLLAGPNVTHLPVRRKDSPGWFEITALCDLWLEASMRRRDFVRGHVRPLERRVRHLHHGLDTVKWDPERRDRTVWGAHDVPTGEPIVLYVGRDDSPLKGVRVLLDAFEDVTVNARLVLVGHMSDETRRRAAAHPRMHVLGWVQGDDLPVLYASADVAVVPSYWENLPFVVMEAMASGVCVVASRTGGIPEQVEDGVSGRLVSLVAPDGGHAAAAAAVLGAALQEVLASAPLRAELGAAARRRIVEHFNEERLGEELVATFRELLDRR